MTGKYGMQVILHDHLDKTFQSTWYGSSYTHGMQVLTSDLEAHT